MTTCQLIYCQGDRKSASLVQLSPDEITSHIGWQLLPCNTPFGIVTVLILSAMVASWHPTGATLAEGWPGTLPCNPALGFHQGDLNFCVSSSLLQANVRVVDTTSTVCHICRPCWSNPAFHLYQILPPPPTTDINYECSCVGFVCLFIEGL